MGIAGARDRRLRGRRLGRSGRGLGRRRLGAPTITVHAWRGGRWSHDARETVPVARLDFIDDELAVNLGASQADATGIDGLTMGLLAPGATLCDGLLAVPGSALGVATIRRRGADGWAEDGELEIGGPSTVTISTRALACADERILAFVAPSDARCAVLEFERRDGAWQHAAPWFPGICPEPGNVGDLAVAYDGKRLLLGAYPATGDDPGAAVLYVRKDEAWDEQARFEPDAAADAENGADRPGERSLFGGRVALGADRVFVSAGRKQVLESAPGYESSSSSYDTVYVFARKGSSWETEEALEHEDVSSGFGDALAVRGSRLFVGSGDGVHAFELRKGTWTKFGQIVGEKVVP